MNKDNQASQEGDQLHQEAESPKQEELVGSNLYEIDPDLHEVYAG